MAYTTWTSTPGRSSLMSTPSRTLRTAVASSSSCALALLRSAREAASSRPVKAMMARKSCSSSRSTVVRPPSAFEMNAPWPMTVPQMEAAAMKSVESAAPCGPKRSAAHTPRGKRRNTWA